VRRRVQSFHSLADILFNRGSLLEIWNALLGWIADHSFEIVLY
jgi:hypothetical protein